LISLKKGANGTDVPQILHRWGEGWR